MPGLLYQSYSLGCLVNCGPYMTLLKGVQPSTHTFIRSLFLTVYTPTVYPVKQSG
jgi:hypothetical protein